MDQRFPVADEEVSVVLPPAQKAVAPLMVGVAGSALAVTANGAEVAWQPPALVTVTLYEPATETAIDCVVAPVDQRLPVAEDEVNVMVLPAQNEDGPLMVGVVATAGLAVTAKAADVALQPAALVTVTVNEPAAETMIDCVVAPVDQRLPVADEEVRLTEPPVQKDDAPLMVGVAGRAFEVTVKAAELALQPPALVTVTVKEPVAETVIDCVVAPVDQRLPVAEDEARVMVVPAQNDAGPLMVGVAGAAFAVTAKAAEVALHPLALVAVTVNEPAAETVIDCVVAPVDQRFPVAAEEVRVMEVPGQKEAGPEMAGVAGAGLAVTTFAAEVRPATVTV